MAYCYEKKWGGGEGRLFAFIFENAREKKVKKKRISNLLPCVLVLGNKRDLKRIQHSERLH